MSALLDAIESLLSPMKNFLSESYACSAVRELRGSLPFVLDNPLSYDFRERSAAGGVLSALGSSVTGPGPAAVLSFLLNKRYDIPKSWAGALLLPHFLDVYVEQQPERLAPLAPFFDIQTGEMKGKNPAARIVGEIRALLGLIDLPFRLRNFDVSSEQLMLIAEEAAAFPVFSRHAFFSSSEEIHRLLLQAY